MTSEAAEKLEHHIRTNRFACFMPPGVWEMHTAGELPHVRIRWCQDGRWSEELFPGNALHAWGWFGPRVPEPFFRDADAWREALHCHGMSPEQVSSKVLLEDRSVAIVTRLILTLGLRDAEEVSYYAELLIEVRRFRGRELAKMHRRILNHLRHHPLDTVALAEQWGCLP